MNNTTPYVQPKPLGRHRRSWRPGCLLAALTTLVLLLLIAGVGWLLFLRPYLHNMAQSELDKALGSAVNQFQLPAEAALLPPGQEIPLTENGINNTIVLNLSPSNPVQQPETRITPSNVRVSFQLCVAANSCFGSAVSMVPQVDNARLVVSNVTVEGVAGLIMSPDELTPLLNKHLADAQKKLPRAITAVTLQDHQMLLRLG